MQKELEKGLVDIGFETNDAKVFAELAGLRSATAGEIAKSRGMARRCVYDSLERLAKKGILTYILKNGVKHYQPADFGILSKMAKKKEEEVSFVVSSIIPRIESFRKTAETESPVEVYMGPAGIKSILTGALDLAKGKEILGYGGNGRISSIVPMAMARWQLKRIEAGIKMRAIYNDTDISRERVAEMKKEGHDKLMKIRITPIKEASNLGTWICGDRVVLWLTVDNPIAISISNKEIASGFRKHFEYLWENGEEV
jgi:sugar-specific transcriptional regulator TrmB